MDCGKLLTVEGGVACTWRAIVVEPRSHKVGDIQEGSVDIKKWEDGLGLVTGSGSA